MLTVIKYLVVLQLSVLIANAQEANDNNEDQIDTSVFHSSAGHSEKTRTFYDYKTLITAYKDLVVSKCYLERIHEDAARRPVKRSAQSSRKTLYISDTQLTKHQIWRIAGSRISEFCRGYPTYLLQDTKPEYVPIEDINDLYEESHHVPITRKQQAPRHKRQTTAYFRGRLHRGQTQSQYLNIGSNQQPGKAEAESSPDGSRAVVTGNSGMGQAQSQSSVGGGCEECYGTGAGLDTHAQSLGYGPGRFGAPGQLSGGPGTGILGQRPGMTQAGGIPVGPDGTAGFRPGSAGYPGQYQPGMSSQYHPGSPGQIPSGSYAPGQFQPGAAGQYQPGQYPSSHPGQIGTGLPSGQFQPGQQGISPAPGQLPGQLGPGGYQPGQVGSGGYQPGQVGPGGYQPGQAGPYQPGQIGPGPLTGQLGPGVYQPGQPGHVPFTPGQAGDRQFGQPSTVYQPGQIPSSQIPAGQFQPGGQVPLGQLSTGGAGQIPSGPFGPTGQVSGPSQGFQPGQIGTGQAPDGHYPLRPSQELLPGQLAPGQIPSGPIGPGYRQPDQLQPGQYIPGQRPAGIIQGQQIPGQVSRPTGQPDIMGRPGGPYGPDGRTPEGYAGTYPGKITAETLITIHGPQASGSYGRYPGDHLPGASIPGRYPAEQITGQYPGSQTPGSQVLSQQIPAHDSIITGQYPGQQPGVSVQYPAQQPGISGQYPDRQTTGHIPGQHIGTQIPAQYPGQQPGAQYPSVQIPGQYPGQQPSFQHPGQLIAGQIPGQYPGQQPGAQINGQFPGQVINGRIPSQQVGAQIPGQYPGQQIGGQLPGQLQGAQLPGHYPDQQLGGQIPGHYPGQPHGTQIGGQYPGQQVGGQIPGQFPGQIPSSQYPDQYPGSTISGQYPGTITPGQYPGGQIPGQYPGSQITGHVPGTFLPGQYPGAQYPDAQGRYPGASIINGPGAQVTGAHPVCVPGQECVIDPDSNSQAQSSVQQVNGDTQSIASAQGRYLGGSAQSQVSGTYSGTGSFNAQAGSIDGKRGAQTQVSGGKDGASSSAQGIGGLGQTQSQVQYMSDTGGTISNAQSGGFNHATNTQVQAGDEGGMADAQANGPGSTSSQAQIGFSPHDENEQDSQQTPFKGGGSANAQSGAYTGQSQAQIQGKFKYGIRYNGAAQAGSGTKELLEKLRANSSLGGDAQQFLPLAPLKLAPQNISNTQVNIKNSNHNSATQIVSAKNPFKINKPQGGNIQTVNTNLQQPIDTHMKVHNIPQNSLQEEITLPPQQQSNTEDYEYDEDEYDDTDTDTPISESTISQSTKSQKQHILLGPLEDLDAHVVQAKGDPYLPDGMILQPGQTIPGTPGYQIPKGYRGRVTSIAHGDKTLAIGKDSQAQSVTITPGTGNIHYIKPGLTQTRSYVPYTYYKSGQPYVRSGTGTSYTYPKFLTVTKSESGSQNLLTGKKNPQVYYTQSSTCGFFTNSCVFSGAKKICIPKAKSNPDGSPVTC